jgi:hypothetical protein
MWQSIIHLAEFFLEHAANSIAVFTLAIEDLHWQAALSIGLAILFFAVPAIISICKRLLALSKAPTYFAKAVPSKIYAEAASDAVHAHWKGDPLLSKEKYWELVQHNPQVLVSILEYGPENSRLVGFFDVFPLRKEFAEEFLNGRSTEQSLLTPQAVHDPQSASEADYIYIGTVLGFRGVLKQGAKLNLEYAMIHALLSYLDKIYGEKTGRVFFALGSTKLGANWLGKCHFDAKVRPAFGGKKHIVFELNSGDVRVARRAAKSLKPRSIKHVAQIRCQWRQTWAARIWDFANLRGQEF